jgi:hypothetical protein
MFTGFGPQIGPQSLYVAHRTSGKQAHLQDFSIGETGVGGRAHGRFGPSVGRFVGDLA